MHSSAVNASLNASSGATVGAPSTARPSKFKVIAATTLGNGLEMFDFTIYSFFAVLIGKLYFPSNTAFGSLLMAVATFGIGFVMRPLGGIVIGNYADRSGRKSAMSLTIGLMAAGTALIGLAPTYAQIGVFAPLLIVAGRLLQGFSAGGEIGASTTFLMESASSSSRGFLVSWQLASQGGAALIGALSGFLLSHFLSPADLQSWGWRVPFLCGLLIGPVGLYIRRALDETHVAAPREASAFREVLKSHRRDLCVGILMIVGGTASMYIVVFYMPTYLIRVLHMPATTAFLAGCVAGAVLLIGSPLAGLLSDRLPRRKPLMVVSTVLGALLIYPAFWMLNHTAQLGVALTVIAALVACLAFGSGPGFLLLMQGFPKHVRATGMSVVYSVGVSVFGGFAQFIVTWLISTTGNPMSPAWYMVACSVVSLGALFALQEKRAD
ncbi:MFS transporter [Paraburkholderia sp.]|uniref:MFS transporter n=1 Tax=Paraburkholderia sp. TaxID=1926495 RepID=UPI00239EEEA1|nr:MFS transporter [Paraburkholderia sp.]MDE1179297.1 MFS transporter [Paraburkholderia sp.]